MSCAKIALNDLACRVVRSACIRVRFLSIIVRFLSIIVRFSSIRVRFSSIVVIFSSIVVIFLSIVVIFLSIVVIFTSIRVIFLSIVDSRDGFESIVGRFSSTYNFIKCRIYGMGTLGTILRCSDYPSTSSGTKSSRTGGTRCL
jgi:hypothetical protein